MADKEQSRARKAVRSQLLKEKRLAAHMFQMRMLMAMTILCCLAAVVWLVALSTDYWILVTTSQSAASAVAGVPVAENAKNQSSSTAALAGAIGKNQSTVAPTPTKPPFAHSNAGVWKVCFHHDPDASAPNKTLVECSYHNLDADAPELRSNPTAASTILDYRRSVMALAVLSMFVMSLGVAFSFYTFMNPRYTFKRLAAGMHFLTASMTMVLIQVVLGGAKYSRQKLPSRHPAGSSWTYGFSFYLACGVFIVFATSFFIFLIYSRKQKGDKAINEELAMADEHVAMGR